MKLYSFSFSKGQIEEFNEILSYRSKKIFRNYLLNEYVFPEELENLQHRGMDVEVHPYWMTDAEINKLDLLIGQAKKQGYQLSRSAVMRDVFQNLIRHYKNNPVQRTEQMRQTFRIPAGTKARIEKLIGGRTLTFELSNFILDGYVPTNVFPSMRNKELENFNFRTGKEVFDKLDEIAEMFGYGKGGRAKIFRDALTQFETMVTENPPQKTMIEQKLQKVIEDYKEVEKASVIKETIKKYLKE